MTFQQGSKNPRWKGGITMTDSGYRKIQKPDHRRANSLGYVREHIVIFEEFYNCCILPWIDIHHKNSIKTDNRIENMELLPHGKHTSINFKKDMSDRFCLLCNIDNSIDGKYQHWYKYKDGFVCKNCYHKVKNQNKEMIIR